MKPKVVITHWVHPEVLDLLRPACALVSNPTRESLPREEILLRTRDAQAIMVFMPDHIDENFLDSCPGLKIVSAALKGYDNFDVEACTRRGVWFSIVKEALTVPAAELAIGLLIAVSRRLLAGDTFVRSGKFKGWQPHLYGMGMSERTLGVIGMGAIGQAVARRAAALDMKVLYNDIVPLSEEKEKAWGFSHVSLEELLAKSDYLMPLLPPKPDTFHLINGQTIARMKPGSFLINISRGSVVDETAVADALASGHLGGYAADVFEMEDWARKDRPGSIPQFLLQNSDRTFFTPHLGSAVDEIRREIALEAARNILQALSGDKPSGAINVPENIRP
jgi:phosphonate dehydrogenase